MIRHVLAGDKHQLRLVEFPKTKRFDVQEWELLDGKFVKTVVLEVSDYSYYKANSVFEREARLLALDGIELTTRY